jgi:hypothetical protein
MELRAASRGLSAQGLHSHFTDEAETFSGDVANQFLVLAAVADRLACGIDAAGQG